MIPYSDRAKTVDLVAYMPILKGRMVSLAKFKMAAPKEATSSRVLARSEYGILLKNTIICKNFFNFYIENLRPDFKRAEKITSEMVFPNPSVVFSLRNNPLHEKEHFGHFG